jgi:hypothetical protein
MLMPTANPMQFKIAPGTPPPQGIPHYPPAQFPPSQPKGKP